MTQDGIAIFTGANDGIGFERAIGTANTEFRTILAHDDLQKAEAAKLRAPDARLERMALNYPALRGSFSATLLRDLSSNKPDSMGGHP